MDAIRLQFVCGAGWSSRLIAWYGNGYGGYSHVDGVLSTGELIGARSDVVGSKWPGVRIRPAGYEKWARTFRLAIPCIDTHAKQWEEIIRREEGRDYDSGSIIDFILGRHDQHRPGRWICSALQLYGLQQVGLIPELPIPPDQITPNTLLAACFAIGARREY